MMTRMATLVIMAILTILGTETYNLPLLQHLQQNNDPSEPSMLKSPFFQGILPVPIDRVCYPDGIIGIVIHWNFTILQPELNLITEVMRDLERYGILDTDLINQTHKQTLQSLDRANDRYQLFLKGVNARIQPDRDRRSSEWDSIGHFFGVATTGDIVKIRENIQDNFLNTTSVLLREAGHLTATEDIAHDLAITHHHLQDLITSVKSIHQSVMSLAQEQHFGTVTQLVAYQQLNHIVTLIRQQLDNVNQAVSVLS